MQAMAFDFDSLEIPIFKILSAPHTDLTTISAKSVRRQLIKSDPTITPEFLRDYREEINAVIGRVFERVNAQQAEGSNDVEERPDSELRQRKQDEELGEDVLGEEEIEDDEIEATPVPKKAKKASKNELSDAELARQLSNELNGRSRRTSTKPAKARGSTNGALKKGGRMKKSVETVDSDDDTGDGGGRKSKKKSSRSSAGGAKGGFAKEFLLSEPLATVLRVDKLSRPQVVKQLWVYIKDNELQNPGNRREIICDTGLRGIFGVDKIDMFKMNKVLGQHLHELED